MDYKSFDEMPAFISIPEAAQFLGIATPSLYKQITKDKSFPILAIGRRKLVPTDNLKKWIDEKCRKI